MTSEVKTAAQTAEDYHVLSSNPRTTRKVRASYEPALSTLPEDDDHGHDHEHAEEKDRRPRVPLRIGKESLPMSLEQAILTRISRREYSDEPISFSTLSKLLFLANGVREDDDESSADSPYPHRNVPSSGALASTELYFFALNVDDLKAGIYKFDAPNAELVQIKEGHYRRWLQEFSLNFPELAEAAMLVVLVANVDRLTSKYTTRGYRLALLDAGHVSENINLVATAMGLSVCAIGGFVDVEINQALELDGVKDCTVLMLSLGWPRN